MKAQKDVALLVTGSIAAIKTLDLIEALRAEGFGVHVVLTRAPEEWNWVSPAKAEAVSGNPVWTEKVPLEEKSALFRSVSSVLVAPLSAAFISHLAYESSPLAQAVIKARRLGSKLFLAPAMNFKMWEHPAMQRNCALLAESGAIFLGPANGPLACGDEGFGRMIGVKEMAQGLRASSEDLLHPALSYFESARPQAPAHAPYAPPSNAPILVALAGHKVAWADIEKLVGDIAQASLTADYILDPSWAEYAAPLKALTHRTVASKHFDVPDLDGLEHIKLPERARCVFFPFIDPTLATSFLHGNADTLCLCSYLASKTPVVTTAAQMQNLPTGIAASLQADGLGVVASLAQLKSL